MRIVLVVIALYALLFSLVSLIHSLVKKRVKKYNFFTKKTAKQKVEIVKREDDPKRYWIVNLFHFINIIVLAYAVFKFVSL